MSSKIEALLRRFKEPSTWAGIAALGALAGVNPAALTQIGTAGPAVAALLAIFLPEAKHAPQDASVE
ncbi:hypothetical protein HNQ50_001432 [Silvimonas terrae]|uniref:Holin n=1 Tax=Silvimonas terrae TaxID=300266 RepID=A0A840REA8_9NEIS|nr:hypothetical protein [Silvimonas terrae]MBB5190710.1 hypothetical protein [Silvimonas terrae]